MGTYDEMEKKHIDLVTAEQLSSTKKESNALKDKNKMLVELFNLKTQEKLLLKKIYEHDEYVPENDDERDICEKLRKISPAVIMGVSHGSSASLSYKRHNDYVVGLLQMASFD
jgi:hypothetical protein